MYNAEKQMAEALPQLMEAAQSWELKEALELHLEETEGHVLVVEQVFASLDQDPRSNHCEAVAVLLKECKSLAEDFEGSPAGDAAIISGMRKVEHYEIASYGCLHTWAGLLGNEEAAELLVGILAEEEQADTELNKIALAQSNDDALAEAEADEAGEVGATPLRQSEW